MLLAVRQLPGKAIRETLAVDLVQPLAVEVGRERLLLPLLATVEWAALALHHQ